MKNSTTSKIILFLISFQFSYFSFADSGFNINAEVQRIAHILNQIDQQVSRNGAIRPATYNAAVDRLERLADSRQIQKLERVVLQAARVVLNAPPGSANPQAERILARYGGALHHITELRNELVRSLLSPQGQKGLTNDPARRSSATYTESTGLRESKYKEPVRNLLKAAYQPRAGNFSAGLDLLKSRMAANVNGKSAVERWRLAYKAVYSPGGLRTGTARDGTRYKTIPGQGLLKFEGGGRGFSGF